MQTGPQAVPNASQLGRHSAARDSSNRPQPAAQTLHIANRYFPVQL